MDFKSLMRPHMKDISPYIPGKPIEEVRRELNITGEIIKLASNENPHEPIPEVLEAIMEESKNINRYPNSGSHYLCHDVADHLGTEPSRIFVGNGSNEILDLLVRGFVNPDEEVIIPYPSFIAYPLIIHLAGVKEIKVPLKKYRLDMKAMRESVTDKTKMVFICNPNNPTATYVTDEEVSEFLDGLRRDILVVFDEAYYEYVTADDYPETMEMLKRMDNIVILRTFSKIYSLSGLRVGYSISHPDLVTCLHMVRQPFNVNRIAQAAARAAIKYSDRLESRIRENTDQLKLISEKLRELGFCVPESQTNFILAIPPEGMVRDLVGKLMARGVIVRGMSPFGLGSEAIRVTIGTPEENKKFLRELNDIVS